MLLRRSTKQRQLILAYVQSVRSHPTAEEVYRQVQKKIRDITLATVYRNLHVLAEEGIISQLNINNEYRFDGFTPQHQHLICKDCGKVEDIKNKKIPLLAMKKIKPKNFQVERVSIQFQGRCASCVS